MFLLGSLQYLAALLEAPPNPYATRYTVYPITTPTPKVTLSTSSFDVYLAILMILVALLAGAVIISFQVFSFTHGIYTITKGKEGEKIKFDFKKLILNPGVISVIIGLPLFLLSVQLPKHKLQKHIQGLAYLRRIACQADYPPASADFGIQICRHHGLAARCPFNLGRCAHG